MGPKRFGTAGKLAFSFGNVAQDEGSAMAEYAYRKGWRTASLATNTLLVYFKNVVQAFEKRFTQLGGKIAGRESYATGANNVNTAVSRLNGRQADVIVTVDGVRRAAGARLRAALAREQDADPELVGRRRHVLAAEEPAGDGLLRGHVRVGLRRRPEQGRAGAREELKAVTGGFVTGSAAIDGVATAIRRSGGSTNGATLAATMEKFKKVPTLSGLVSFSPQFHSVFGRQYRVIKIHNNKARYVGAVTAKVVPKI